VKAFAIYFRCISLPLFGGLILAFYLSLFPFQKNQRAPTVTTAVSKPAPLSFYADILQAFIPALKNLK